MRYIALLRGINVGGNTMIKMTELKALFESCGFENVVTYINSGNIAFDADNVSIPPVTSGRLATEPALVSTIEDAIEKEFAKTIPVMIREQTAIDAILNKNPFAGQYESHKEMHVLFLRDDLSAEKIAQLMAAAGDGERFAVHGREIYCHLRQGVADSLLGKGFIDKKLKVSATARNWRTVEKLAVM